MAVRSVASAGGRELAQPGPEANGRTGWPIAEVSRLGDGPAHAPPHCHYTPHSNRANMSVQPHGQEDDMHPLHGALAGAVIILVASAMYLVTTVTT